jgi:hypothetical protein
VGNAIKGQNESRQGRKKRGLILQSFVSCHRKMTFQQTTTQFGAFDAVRKAMELFSKEQGVKYVIRDPQ